MILQSYHKNGLLAKNVIFLLLTQGSLENGTFVWNVLHKMWIETRKAISICSIMDIMISWYFPVESIPLVPGAGGPLPCVAHGVEQRAAVDPPHAVLLHILRRHAVVPCHVPLLYVSFEKTSLKSLRLRKLLDQFSLAYWALLGPSGSNFTKPFWLLSGPYSALLSLT